MVTLCCSGDGSPEELDEEEDLAGLGLLGLEEVGGREKILGVSLMASEITPSLALAIALCVEGGIKGE